jgi:hypothetical protein
MFAVLPAASPAVKNEDVIVNEAALASAKAAAATRTLENCIMIILKVFELRRVC